MGDFKMPSLGADMDAGVLVRWLRHPGDKVQKGDSIAVVETDKSTIEVEVFEAGVVEALLVPEGERVPVGTVLATIRPAGVAGAAGAAAAAAAAGVAAVAGVAVAAEHREPEQPPIEVHGVPAISPLISPLVRHHAAQHEVDLDTIQGSGRGGTVTRADVEQAAGRAASRAASRAAGAPRASPLARRLARENGIELATLRGTGPGGAIVEGDVRRAAAGVEAAGAGAKSAGTGEPSEPAVRVGAPPPAAAGPPRAGEDRQQAMRRAIGALMARSKREIPHYYLSTTIDMSRAMAWLEQANRDRPVASRLVTAALFVKATGLAVAKVPEVNGHLVDGRFQVSPAVHVGVAVSLRQGGVIAPAIHDVGVLAMDELMAKLRDLVGRTRTGVLRSSEMSDPTITVTNLGELGVDSLFGVIYPPQVAIVGFGRVADRPWAEGGMLGIRPCVTATLSADHRVSDGHRGALFLSAIDRLLQRPETL